MLFYARCIIIIITMKCVSHAYVLYRIATSNIPPTPSVLVLSHRCKRSTGSVEEWRYYCCFPFTTARWTRWLWLVVALEGIDTEKVARNRCLDLDIWGSGKACLYSCNIDDNDALAIVSSNSSSIHLDFQSSISVHYRLPYDTPVRKCMGVWW